MSKKLSQSEIDELVKSLLEGELGPESPAAPASTPAAAPAAAPAPVSTPASGPAAAPDPVPTADATSFEQIVDLGPITQAEVDAVTRGETPVKAAPPSAAATSAPPPDGARTAAEAQAAKTRRALSMARLYGALMEIELPVSVELGRARLPLGDVLALGPGSVITLENLANSPVDVLVNRVPLMKGEVLAIGEKYGVRIIESNIDTKAS